MQFKLTLIIIGIGIIVWMKEIHNAVFCKKESLEDSNNLENGTSEIEVLLDNANESIR